MLNTISFLFTFIEWLFAATLFLLVLVFIYEVYQTFHAVLRNYPVLGHFRYFLETLGEYFRQYFFANDREELPFNRANRNWVYRTSKGLGGMIGFGSTHDMREPGSIIFVNSPYPVLEEDCLPAPSMVIGEQCEHPFVAKKIFNIFGMNYGALSAPAMRALSLGAGKEGCWMNTGEGGISDHHKAGGCDLIYQIGAAKYGVRDENGRLNDEKEEIANIRGIPVGFKTVISNKRFPE